MGNKLLKYSFLLQLFGFILLLFVGIIFTAIKIKAGTIKTNFLIIYWTYVGYILLTILFYGKESRVFNKEFDESPKLLHLRMNHVLTITVPFITFAIAIFINKSFLESPFQWLGGLVLLVYGAFYFFTGYYLRYRELDKIEGVKELVRRNKK